MIAGLMILAIGFAVGIYDLIAELTGLQTISGEIQGWQRKLLVLVVFSMGVLAGHLITF